MQIPLEDANNQCGINKAGSKAVETLMVENSVIAESLQVKKLI